MFCLRSRARRALAEGSRLTTRIHSTSPSPSPPLLLSSEIAKAGRRAGQLDRPPRRPRRARARARTAAAGAGSCAGSRACGLLHPARRRRRCQLVARDARGAECRLKVGPQAEARPLEREAALARERVVRRVLPAAVTNVRLQPAALDKRDVASKQALGRLARLDIVREFMVQRQSSWSAASSG